MFPLATKLLLVLAPGVYAATGLDQRAHDPTPSSCKAIPGDAAWPSRQVWSQFNDTLQRRLLQTVPQAAVCRPGGYGSVAQNEAACAALRQEWDYPKAFLDSAADIMNPWYQNTSCSPFYRLNQACTLGNYVSYAIPVGGPADVVAAINFTKTHNVRLVIKNTGHDYLGRSTGTGGLSLWTHRLKSKEVLNYTSSAYTGPAIKVGAGVTGGEALLYASKYGYRLVSGDCPTVGYAGGYSSGGGHSLLNSVHGLAADNVLEWEVVTADGRHLIASATENTDLYWALSGGGGGNLAVVLSMTAKVHVDSLIGAATLSFNATASRSDASYVSAINAWWGFLPSLVDAGASPSFNLLAGKFLVYNTTAPGRSATQMAELYAPYLAKLDALRIPYEFATYAAPSYVQHYNATDGPLPYGPYEASQLFNSRLIPRTLARSPGNLTSALLSTVAFDPAANWQIGCLGINVNATHIAHPDNAVVPYWRDAMAICLEFSIYNWTIPEATMVARRQDLAAIIHPAIEAATLGSGAYLNEADPLVYPPGDAEKWQSAFFGTHYQQLRALKRKWDPQRVFYAYATPGAEDWREDSDGRLCRAW